MFELTRAHASGYAPELAQAITGIHPDTVREIARCFASAEPAMIFAGYRIAKWLHGDLMQRSLMLLLSLTGNLGNPGGGLHILNMAKEEDQLGFMFPGPSSHVARRDDVALGLCPW